MIIACCDSRAAPETIFDAGPGEIFVMRNVANLVPPYAPDGKHHATSAAIEFAVLSLGVSNVVVMGHGRCGGIGAVVNGSDPLSSGDFIGKWMSDVKDVATAVRHDHDQEENHVHDLQTAVEHASVEHSLANLRTFPWLRMRENKKAVGIHGAWFDIGLGELHVYDESERSWALV
jgi:carbonic anhydrase